MLRICRVMLMAVSLVVSIAVLAAGNGGGIAVQTIRVSSVSPLLTLKFWDYEAEDGDWVRIIVDGEVYQEFELKNAPKTVSIPILFSDKDEVFVNVIGTRSGNGPVTYAVQATGLGSTTEVYKNYTDVGSGNSYRIIKTKDDLFSTCVNCIVGLFGIGDDESDDVLEVKSDNAIGENKENGMTCSGTGTPEPKAFDLMNEKGLLQVSSKSKALSEFNKMVKNKADRLDGCVEYTAYVIERDGIYYMTQLARGELKTDEENNALTMTSPGLHRYKTDKIVVQLHSHPSGDNFSAPDIKTVQSGKHELVLVNQTNGHEAVLTPEMADSYDANSETIRRDGVAGKSLNFWQKLFW